MSALRTESLLTLKAQFLLQTNAFHKAYTRYSRPTVNWNIPSSSMQNKFNK